ncbi:MAG: hypothetical protein JWN68_2424, partial [Nocardioides sp.]|nr:hypothetical protein [Nocardioides sp.]
MVFTQTRVDAETVVVSKVVYPPDGGKASTSALTWPALFVDLPGIVPVQLLCPPRRRRRRASPSPP